MSEVKGIQEKAYRKKAWEIVLIELYNQLETSDLTIRLAAEH